jgi:TolA-binding protein
MVDLHPDELLERADGDLTPAEKAHVERHLAACPACRLERRARADFGRLVSPREVDVNALVARVLHPERARGRSPPLRTMHARSAMLVAALLAMGGVAAAASAWSVRRGASSHASENPAVPSLGHERTATAPVPAPPTIAAELPPHVAVEKRSPASAEHRSRHAESTAALAAATPDEQGVLFENANAARRRGDRATAETLYRRLIAAHPESIEARESLALLGRMLLDDGAPSDALACFDEYLRRGGELAAEAMLGKAIALQQLDRTEDERAAWTVLLQAYPGSLHAERARSRLAVLGR